MKNVTIYSTPTCVYCRMAKEFFKAHDVQYTEHDVAADETALREMAEKTHQMGVPVIDVEGEIVVGFDEGELSKLLELKSN